MSAYKLYVYKKTVKPWKLIAKKLSAVNPKPADPK